MQTDLGDISTEEQPAFLSRMVLFFLRICSKAGNSYISSTLGDDLPTGSDPDLVAATNPSATLNDAVILEFDFAYFQSGEI
jgi:hypothetical protein